MFSNDDSSTMSPEEQEEVIRAIEARVTQKTFLSLYDNIVSTCFDSCINKPTGILGENEKTCVNNCVNRYIETLQIVNSTVRKDPSFKFSDK
ncbi:hypothetical protein HZS_1676 [Henneguya salminicola]|nr:hypothetical protein HZS_1676 [Henneguya salminicola]